MTRCKVKLGHDGIWYARPYLGRTVDGKPIQPYQRFTQAETEEEAQALADIWFESLTAFGQVKSMILADLLGEYISVRAGNGSSPNSIKTYELFTRYVRRFLPGRNANDLTAIDFVDFEQRLMAPKNKGGQGVSRNTTRNVHDFLRSAYKFFVSLGICDSNPLLNVEKPRLEIHESKSLSPFELTTLDEQLRALINPPDKNMCTYKSAVVAMAGWLMLRTGMRCGESCACLPSDVFADLKYIHVGGTVIAPRRRKPFRRNVTKGRKCRNIALTDSDLDVLRAFISFRNECCPHVLRNSPIITRDGGFARPDTIGRALNTLAKKKANLQGITPHVLRHTHATWLLTHGVDLKTVSERLGHAKEETTLQIYAHVLPGRDAYAADVFGKAIENAESDLF